MTCRFALWDGVAWMVGWTGWVAASALGVGASKEAGGAGPRPGVRRHSPSSTGPRGQVQLLPVSHFVARTGIYPEVHHLQGLL